MRETAVMRVAVCRGEPSAEIVRVECANVRRLSNSVVLAGNPCAEIVRVKRSKVRWSRNLVPMCVTVAENEGGPKCVSVVENIYSVPRSNSNSNPNAN